MTKVMTPRAGIFGASLLIIAFSITSLVMSHNASGPEGESLSTTTSDNRPAWQPGPSRGTSAVLGQQTTTPSSSSQAAQDSKKQTATAFLTGTTGTTTIATGRHSSLSPSSAPAPTPAPASPPSVPGNPTPTPPPPTPTPPTPAPPTPPTPQPGFSIVLHPEQAQTVSLPLGGQKQLQVPFTIVYDEGFVKTGYGQPGCRFLAAPAGHDVLCDLSQKEADTGWLTMQYTDASAAGHYVVEAVYPIGDTTRTATYEFDLGQA